MKSDVKKPKKRKDTEVKPENSKYHLEVRWQR
jgi:hypothetical protein